MTAVEAPGVGSHLSRACSYSAIPELKAGHLLPPGHRSLQVGKKELTVHLLQMADQGSLRAHSGRRSSCVGGNDPSWCYSLGVSPARCP